MEKYIIFQCKNNLACTLETWNIMTVTLLDLIGFDFPCMLCTQFYMVKWLISIIN
jgi:hypothetical protein